MYCALLLSIIFVSPFVAVAQEQKNNKPGDEMIDKYLAAEADKLGQKFLDGSKTLDEWKQKRPRLYREYMDMLGLWPIPEKTPLLATKTGEVEAHGVVVEKVHFQSKPGLYVTANVYRPRQDGQRHPAIVYVCGHSFMGRDGNKSAYQDHGFWFANNGYVCIVLDTLQLGEIPGVHHGTYGQPWRHISGYRTSRDSKQTLPEDKLENRFWWYSIGYTPAGVEAWNGIRAIDYLCSRPDVDPDRIGVTGISGGGAATFWIAAADERIKVAVPVSGMSDLQSYVNNKVINGHCDCMFLYNTYQWDWTTIATLVAPRPLLFANSDNDSIFPMDGNRRVFAKLKQIYTMYDAPNLVDEHISPGGHAYRPDLRIAIFKFINKHLKGDVTTPVEDSAKYTPLEGRKLRAFPEESNLPTDAINGHADEVFIQPAKVTLPEKGKFEEWKQGMLRDLRTRCFAAFPMEIPAAERLPESAFSGLVLKTEPGIKAFSSPLSPFELKKRYVYIQRDGDPKKLAAEYPPACVLSLCGEREPWTHKSPPNYVERAHALLGRTVDQGKVRDVIAAVKYLKSARGKEPEDECRLLGKGQAGILAAYAALFEPAIKEVVVIDPPKSHREGPYFLDVLRVLDVPEALGLLAPTPLTLIGASDPAFDRTAAIYKLAGVADKLTRK
jgi:cephalosporin-C deacetylase-like acetyl esterase